MHARVLAISLLAFCPLLSSQQAPSIGTAALPSADSVQVPNGPGQEFAFTKIDSDLFDEANAVDALYEKKGLVMHDPALQAFLDSVGKRVLANRPIPENVAFRFRALRDPMVNAFALPNGSIYVTTGLLALLENEAQLAGILGHETSHVFERHTYLENRSVRKKALTINILEIVASAAPVGGNLSQSVQIFGASVQLAAMIGSDVIVATIYGYSRDMERQADSDGIAAMTAASYDPSAMARSFELLDHDSSLEYEPIQGFYRDHPKLSERREFAMQFSSAHKAGALVTGDPKTYLDNVSAAICYEIGADLSSRRERTAVDRASRLSAAFPDNPKYKVLLADSYRALGAKTTAPTDEERTRHGQAEHRKEYFSMTPEEEQNKIREKPEGQAALHDNEVLAEQLYTSVIQSNPSYAAAHSGLGFLFEQEGKYNEAAIEYQTYLQMESGTSMDHLRIQRRLAAVQKLTGLQGHTQ
jgi:Zn-dependent protease with chaperone function